MSINRKMLRISYKRHSQPFYQFWRRNKVVIFVSYQHHKDISQSYLSIEKLKIWICGRDVVRVSTKCSPQSSSPTLKMAFEWPNRACQKPAKKFPKIELPWKIIGVLNSDFICKRKHLCFSLSWFALPKWLKHVL